MTNSDNAIHHISRTRNPNGINSIETAISGIPMLCVRRFIGWRWPSAYSSIQSSQDLPPIICSASVSIFAAILYQKLFAEKGFRLQAVADVFFLSARKALEKTFRHERVGVGDVERYLG